MTQIHIILEFIFVITTLIILKNEHIVTQKGSGVDINMSLESFHIVLNYFYLDGKKVKRLDKSIHQLLMFLRDKTVERIIKVKMGKFVVN